jgi:hypothetical protein
MPFDIKIIDNEFTQYEEDNHFGHKFTVRLISGDDNFSECNLRWYERTNKPYLPNQIEGEWIELVSEIGENSEVFTNWVYREDNMNSIDLIDPPGINYGAGDEINSRTLEFFIIFINDSNDAVWLKLKQELSCEGNSITCQEMEILEKASGENPGPP